MARVRLQTGTPVVVWFTDETSLKGVLKHTPSGAGDHFIIEDKDGDLHSINPLCSQLIELQQTPKEDIPF